jgi:CubicO group peptidase (beta-lactamase class C family)
MVLARRCLLLLSLLLPALAATAQPVAWPAPDWATSTPEAQGMDSRALAALVEYGGNAQMDSLVVVRNGRLVAEAYYAPFQPGMKHRINSATKGVVSLLAGIASGQGLLGSTDAPMLGLFPERAVANVDPRKQAVTLQHLLDMTSGIDWVEPLNDRVPDTLIAMERSADWQQFILDRPMAQVPGAGFNYNSGNSHLVSAVLARKTGMGTGQFAAQQLFKPLAISDYRWQKDPQGVATGGFGLSMRTTDMAKIGLLVLQRGEWDGKQLVPRAWVDKIFNAAVPMFPAGGWLYGDFWWTLPARKAYLAVGYNRQLIVVLPELGVVAAMTGRTHYPIEDVIGQLERAVKSSQPLPQDAQAGALLQARIREAAIENATPSAVAEPALAREISGKAWRLEPNGMGLAELTLHFGAEPSYELASYVARGSSETRKVSRPIGTQGRFAGRPAGEGALVLSKGAWVDGNTLSVIQRWPEEGWTVSYLLRFDGSRVEITQVDRFGRRQTLAGTRAD